MEELVQEMPGKQRRSLWGKLASLLQVVLQELPPERWEEPRPEEEEGGMETEQAVDPVSSPGCLWGKVADFSVVEKERKSKRTWKCLSRPQKQVMAVVDGVTLVAAVSVKVLQEGDTYDTLLDTAHRLHGPCSSGSALKHCFQNQNESASSWQSYFQTLYMNKTTNINRAESRTPWACCSPLLCWSSQWWMGFFLPSLLMTEACSLSLSSRCSAVSARLQGCSAAAHPHSVWGLVEEGAPGEGGVRPHRPAPLSAEEPGPEEIRQYP